MFSGFMLASSFRLSPVSASRVTNILSNGVIHSLSRVGMSSTEIVALTGLGTFGAVIFVVGDLSMYSFSSNHL